MKKIPKDLFIAGGILLILILLYIFAAADLARGEEELMVGDADKKEVIMGLNEAGLFDSVTLRYSWDD